jgi:hypothetical protein
VYSHSAGHNHSHRHRFLHSFVESPSDMSRKLISALVVSCTVFFGWYLVAEETSSVTRRATALKHQKEGNFRDAYEIFRELSLNEATDPKKVGADLLQGVQALQRLNRVAEIDPYLTEFVDLHQDNWRALISAAQAIRSTPHYGTIIAQEYERGNQRGEDNGSRPKNETAYRRSFG